MRKIKLIISFLLLVFSIVACTKENAHLKVSIKEITNCLTDSKKECTCPKNITYTIEDIPSGSYKISINGKIIGEILMY